MCLFTRFDQLQALSHAVSEVARGRSRSPLVGNHSLYFRRVSVADQRRAAQLALPLLIFRGQDVTQKSLIALHFSRPGFLEALGRAFMCLQLWHEISSNSHLALGSIGLR